MNDQKQKDYVQSLALLKTRQAGGFGSVSLSNEAIGMLAGPAADAARVVADYASGVTDKEQTRQNLGNIFVDTIKTFAGGVANVAVEVVGVVISTWIPILTPIVMAVKDVVKEKFVPFVREMAGELVKIASNVWQKVRSWF